MCSLTYHRARNAPETLWARFSCRSLWTNWPCFSRSPFCTRFTLEGTDQVREGELAESGTGGMYKRQRVFYKPEFCTGQFPE